MNAGAPPVPRPSRRPALVMGGLLVTFVGLALLAIGLPTLDSFGSFPFVSLSAGSAFLFLGGILLGRSSGSRRPA